MIEALKYIGIGLIAGDMIGYLIGPSIFYAFNAIIIGVGLLFIIIGHFGSLRKK